MTTFISRGSAVLALLALGTIAAPAAAQETTGRDAEFRWARAVRIGSVVRVANITGDIRVVGADVERVELVARRRGTSDDRDARVVVREHADGVTICALRNGGGRCEDDGIEDDDDRGRRWDRDRASYDLEVRVPRRMRVDASSVSGDVAVSGTALDVRAASVSGDIALEHIRATGRVRATSVSGDVTADLEAVARETEMEVKSVSGDVRLAMPRATGFDLEMSTVSGDLTTDFEMQMRRFNRRRITATVNNGGADLRISTVSGDVRLAHN